MTPAATQPAPAELQPIPQPRRARTTRPLVELARRPDGRGLTFVERLEQKMHKRLGHRGPVCHPCRINASTLAALATGG